MKTLLAVAVLATTALSFSANALTRESFLDAAAAYKADADRNYVSQGIFMGAVAMAGEAIPNCVPAEVTLGKVSDKVATLVLHDNKINAMPYMSDMLIAALNKAYPCQKL